MMMINTSETCATTKLIQCRLYGISTNDVSQKFIRSPEDATDLTEDEFMARKAVLVKVRLWCCENMGNPDMILRNQWAPILYSYEVCLIFRFAYFP